MVIGFFSSMVFSINTSAINSLYWGGYINESVSNYWIYITGEYDIAFRGNYQGLVMASTDVSNVYFDPGNSGSNNNFTVTFSSYAYLGSDGYFIPVSNTILIGAHYYMTTGKFKMDAGSSGFHYYSK